MDGFQGNAFFASMDMAYCLTPGRKDDLESLMSVLSFVYAGKIPIIEYIYKNQVSFEEEDVTRHILEIRIKHKDNHLK